MFVVRLQSDEEEAYREVFLKAAPKFFNPFVSDYTNPQETLGIDKDEPTNRQVAMFLKDVSYQNKVFNVRSIAKLYNNLTLTVSIFDSHSSSDNFYHFELPIQMVILNGMFFFYLAKTSSQSQSPETR